MTFVVAPVRIRLHGDVSISLAATSGPVLRVHSESVLAGTINIGTLIVSTGIAVDIKAVRIPVTGA